MSQAKSELIDEANTTTILTTILKWYDQVLLDKLLEKLSRSGLDAFEWPSDDEIDIITLSKGMSFNTICLGKAAALIKTQLSTIKNTIAPTASSGQESNSTMPTGNEIILLPIMDGDAAGVVCIFACVTGLFVGAAASFAQIVDIGLGLVNDLTHTLLRILNKWDHYNKAADKNKKVIMAEIHNEVHKFLINIAFIGLFLLGVALLAAALSSGWGMIPLCATAIVAGLIFTSGAFAQRKINLHCDNATHTQLIKDTLKTQKDSMYHTHFIDGCLDKKNPVITTELRHLAAEADRLQRHFASHFMPPSILGALIAPQKCQQSKAYQEIQDIVKRLQQGDYETDYVEVKSMLEDSISIEKASLSFKACLQGLGIMTPLHDANAQFMRPLLIRRTDPMDTKAQAQWRAQMIKQIEPPRDKIEETPALTS